MNNRPMIRIRSGAVDGDLLDAVIYRLIRDGYVSPGRFESIVQDVETDHDGKVCRFSNGWLAAYAKDLADRFVSLRSRSKQKGDV